MTSELVFLGAAGTVTGSKYLLQTDRQQVLLDCGLFQGLKQLRLRNWDAPPFAPRELDAVVLSHAHLDHSGYLPALMRHGFRGHIHCTSGTLDLLRILLPDSARLMAEQAGHANKHGYSRHHPALPLYTEEEVERALQRVEKQRYGKLFSVGRGLNVRFHRAGHILGAAIVECRLPGNDGTLVFSGDLGRYGRPILRDPESVPDADVLLVEGTYGNRLHPPDARDQLAALVNDAVKRGGPLIVPAFAVGRTQELLWTLRTLEDEGRIPRLPVFVDSPMAINVGEVYLRHPEDHDLEMDALQDQARNPLSTAHLRLVQTREASKELNTLPGAGIIIAGSGMATGGRVLHHLRRWLPEPSATVMLVGYQAAGTRGRSLQDGAPTIRIHGQDVPVRARVATIDGMSAHADQEEILRWLGGFKRPPRQTFVVHAEADAATALVERIRATLGWTVQAAIEGERVRLG